MLVHNYFNLNTIDQVKQVEETELKGLFNATKTPQGFWLSDHFKHFVLMNNDKLTGKASNIKSIENIRTMIKGAPIERNPNVLKTILTQVELLLSEFLIVQKSNKSSDKKTTSLWSTIKAVFGGDNNEWKVRHKQQVKVKLEVKPLNIQTMNTLWFMCPIEPLPNNVTLSTDLKFNYDGSVYVDFSSQFIPDLNIVSLNNKGDISINIECPSCKDVTVEQQSMTSILVQGEKVAEPSGEPYFNTRRTGNFEVELSLNGLETGLIPNILSLKKQISDGIIRITIPAQKINNKLDKDKHDEEL